MTTTNLPTVTRTGDTITITSEVGVYSYHAEGHRTHSYTESGKVAARALVVCFVWIGENAEYCPNGWQQVGVLSKPKGSWYGQPVHNVFIVDEG